MIQEIDGKINYNPLNIEHEFSSRFTLNQRAVIMVQSEEYQNKLKLIKQGHLEITKY